MNAREIHAALANAAAQNCLMCCAPTDGVSCFLPTDSQAYGARPGKQRIFVFALCSACWSTTTPDEREAALERRWAA